MITWGNVRSTEGLIPKYSSARICRLYVKWAKNLPPFIM